MTNIIKVLDHKTIAMTTNGQTKIVTKRVSTLGLSSWYNVKGEVYA
jgi:3-deoxy-D-manno-octulosonate 8-phosphate phosphatase KdsC-like HAD superfamily phosphatase